jgi:hypothetical protein
MSDVGVGGLAPGRDERRQFGVLETCGDASSAAAMMEMRDGLAAIAVDYWPRLE